MSTTQRADGPAAGAAADRNTGPGPRFPEVAGSWVGRVRVPRAWTDHNGHMNLAAYLVAFDRRYARWCDDVGIGPKQIPETGRTIFVAQTHLVYRRELHLGDVVDIGLRVLALSDKRMHTHLTMVRGDTGEPVCVNEKLDVCVDLSTRRSAPFPPAVATRLQALHARERAWPAPLDAGQRVELPSPRESTHRS